MDTLVTTSNQELASFQESGCSPERGHLLLIDARLKVQAASRSFYTASQLTPAQTVGRELSELGDGQWASPDILKFLNSLGEKDGESEQVEAECDLPALGRRTMMLSGRQLCGRNFQTGMSLLCLRDITEQKRGAARTELLRELQAPLASMGYAVILTDPETRVTSMNPTAEALTGWTQDDAWGKLLKEVFNIVSEQSSLTMEDPVRGAIGAGNVVDVQRYTVLVNRDGSERPIGGNAAPILDSTGHLAGAVLIIHDITSRRKVERETEISEIRYRRLFEAAHDGIMILDAATLKLLDVNPFLTTLLGYPKEYFLGKELWEIGVLSDAETSKRVMATLQRHGRIRYEDLPLQRKDGAHIPVEFVSNVYPEGRRNVIQCNIRDITERKRLSLDLLRARRDAETANRSKSEFLANMSHEIRTPMGAILGFADMLLHKSADECAKVGCVQIIHRNASHLLELINEILDLSKVETGQMKVERVPCDLPQVLSEMVTLMRPRAEEKGLAFSITFPGPVPRMIRTDPMRLRQILVNLLGNAVKFTERGTIEMRVTDEGAGTPNIRLRVDVIDSGIGMTPDQQGRVFKPFAQGDASITRKFGGTGLGLAISRQLAQLLNGDVTAASQAGVGSTFTLAIDCGPSDGVEQLHDMTEAQLPAAVDMTAQADVVLSGRILLVEDGADNQRLFRMELESAGAAVTSALDGRAAVDLAATQTFDVILMDMQMPVMDGYAATMELRRKGLTTPIIALTAHAMAEDREKCLAAGCSDYLSKPTDEETLLRTVHKHLADNRPITESISEAAAIAPALPPAAPAGKSSAEAPSGVIRSSLSGNPRIMQIIPEFVSGLPGQVGEMIEFFKRDELDAVQKIAHRLLGTCGGYGLGPISEPARTLEQSIKAGKDKGSVAPEVDSLVALLRRVEGYDESKEKITSGTA